MNNKNPEIGGELVAGTAQHLAQNNTHADAPQDHVMSFSKAFPESSSNHGMNLIGHLCPPTVPEASVDQCEFTA